MNLGLFQHDVSVIWDLAPHDLSIMDHIIKGEPEAIVATGERHLNGVEDVAFMTVYFPRNVIAHINVNWLSPVKIRTTLIGGQKKMLVWNDLVADEKVRVYDKGVQIASGEGLRDLLVSYRTGDMWAPQVEQLEALHVELDYFADCIAEQQDLLSTMAMRDCASCACWRLPRLDPKERRAGSPVNEFCSIAPDVKLGARRQAFEIHQPVRLPNRRRNQDRSFRRNSKERERWAPLQDFKPHVRLRGRDHRRQRLHRSRRDLHQRLLSARDDAGWRNSDRKGLASGNDHGETRGFDRLGFDHSFERGDW